MKDNKSIFQVGQLIVSTNMGSQSPTGPQLIIKKEKCPTYLTEEIDEYTCHSDRGCNSYMFQTFSLKESKICPIKNGHYCCSLKYWKLYE